MNRQNIQHNNQQSIQFYCMQLQNQQKVKIDLILNTSITHSSKIKSNKRGESSSPAKSYCLGLTNENQKCVQQKQDKYYQNANNFNEFKVLDINKNHIFYTKSKSITQQTKNALEKHAKQPNQSFTKMMETIVEKYRKKKVVNPEKQTMQIKYQHIPLNGSINFKNTIDLYEDRIQLYKLMKSNKIPTTTFNSQSFNKGVEGTVKRNRAITSCSQRKYWTIQGMKCTPIKPNQKPKKKLIYDEDSIQKKRPSTTQGFRRKKSIQISKNKKFLPIKTIDEGDYSYSKRLRSFLQFLLKVNYSNKIYVSLDLISSNYLQRDQQGNKIKKYKAYVGGGNNSLLIKSILGNRFWFEITDNIYDKELNFCWTQNKIDNLHAKQSCLYCDSQAFILMGGGRQKQVQKYEKLSPQTYENNKKILSGEDVWNVQKFINAGGFEIPFEQYQSKLITNHLPYNSFIATKKKLHHGLFNYYNFHKKQPFDHIPRTYTVTGIKDIQFSSFLQYVKRSKLEDSLWIVKPGEHTNRGNGILIAKAANVEKIVNRFVKHDDGTPMSYIIQSYISKPLLYNNRKFDIRHYLLLTSVKGNIKAYWYKQGYIRTSSQIFDLEDIDNAYIHLTNDAIQKSHQLYGVYQLGNKLSYNQFQRYMDYNYIKSGFRMSNLLEQMKIIIKDVIRANYKAIDARRNECNFQLFGLDFMIDDQLKPWLIQINSNPCLQMCCPLLNRIIPGLIQNTFRLGLDPLLPPRNHYPVNKRYTLTDKHLKNLKYELIFDEYSWKDSIPIKNLNLGEGDQKQQQFPDDGKPLILDSQNFDNFF